MSTELLAVIKFSGFLLVSVAEQIGFDLPGNKTERQIFSGYGSYLLCHRWYFRYTEVLQLMMIMSLTKEWGNIRIKSVSSNWLSVSPSLGDGRTDSQLDD